MKRVSNKIGCEIIKKMILAVIVCVLTGCAPSGQGALPTVPTVSDTGFVAALPGNYDSADTAIVISKNLSESTITFQTLAIGRRYTLNYDGATTYADKYGQALSLEQIQEGEIVDVTFMRERKRLNSLQVSSDTFVKSGVEDFELSENLNYMRIGNEEFSFAEDMVVISESGVGERMDLNPVDILTIIGYDHTIHSVIVEQGHGYLRLENDSYFIGGWLEVSQRQIVPIAEDMLLAVPAGTYEVTVSHEGSSGTETITVAANEEVSLDVSKWQGEVKFGSVIFTVTPTEAKVYIDGEQVDISGEVSLEYGIHQMIVMADGYQTISRYMKVGSEVANLNIIMEEESKETASGNSASQNSASSNSASQNSTQEGGYVFVSVPDSASGNTVSGQAVTQVTPPSNTSTSSNQVISDSAEYKVYIEAPQGVEVYVDGSYVGIAPVSFPKTEGSVVITLRRSGYQTRSYTITLDDSEKDVNYSFSELQTIG